MKITDKGIDITWDLKKAELKDKVQQAWNNVKSFISNNKELVAIAIPVIGKGAYDIVKSIKRSHDNKETQRLKDNYIWDPKLGMYFECRKKLTTNQRLEFASRRDAGESVGSILRSMKVLK